jgi:endonuclease YncB( thermonuclease family)
VRYWLLAVVMTAGCSSVAPSAATPAPDPAPAVAAPRAASSRVIDVVDGDSLVVKTGAARERVRLFGIDCPEHGQRFASEARRCTASLCQGRQVTVARLDRDSYGRTVARVQLDDGRDLGNELLRAGLAWHYKQYSNDSSMAQLEQEARDARRGLWTDSHPVPPWEWRRNHRDRVRRAAGGISLDAEAWT